MSMKKLGWMAMLVVVIAPVLFPPEARADQRQGTFEIYLGSYNINDQRFKDVYETGGAIRGIILSSALFYNFDFYTEIKAFYKTGMLTYTKEETKLLLVPVSLGVRFVFPSQIILPYIGLGGDVYFYYENNSIGTVLNMAKGYHVLGGAYLQLGKKIPIMLNVKLKYTTAQAKENDLKLQLGGLEYGASLAISF
jgi:hypothetical protein